MSNTVDDNPRRLALSRFGVLVTPGRAISRWDCRRSEVPTGPTGRSRWAWTVDHSPLTTHHSSLATHHSPLLLLILVLSGCADSELQTTYGERSGPYAYSSVNGTAVFSGMFELSGDTVFSWNVLSPRLYHGVDAIVWFPDDFEPPSDEVLDWFEDWMLDSPGRTLIYVGRDFDAEASYWKAVGPLAPAKELKEIQHREKFARTAFEFERKEIPDNQDHEWFTVQKTLDHRTVTTIDGKEEWTDGIDETKLGIELNGRFVPAESFDVLLESQWDMLIGRQERWDDSQVIVVTNGSFLLNYPLANHEHRKLAGRLIDAVGPPGQTVVFLETSVDGPEILEDDPAVGPPLGVEMFSIWPTNWILIHFAIAGIIFCFAKFPIFGRPLEPEADDRSDFGKHIVALGELLARSRDTSYAQARLEHYRKTIEK